MKEKPTLFFLTLMLLTVNVSYAQPCRSGTINIIGPVCESADLVTSNSLGSLQWQEADSIPINFLNISGATDTAYSAPCSPLIHQPYYDAFFRVISNGNNCSDTSLVFKVTFQTDLSASFSYIDSNNEVYFQADSTKYSDSFKWNFGDGTTGSGASPVHFYNPHDTGYHVCLTVETNVGCLFENFCNEVYNPVNCVAYFIIVPDASNPHLWHLIDESSVPQGSYLYINWGNDSIGSNSSNHIYPSSGKYQICIYYSAPGLDPTRCQTSYCDSTVLIQANDQLMIGWPTAFNMVPCMAQKNVNVFPNPCSLCTIQGIENANDIVVSDIVGRKLNVNLTKSLDGFNLNLTSVSAGIYFAKNIRTGQTIKLVKD